MLANLIYQFEVLLVIEQWFKQTHYFSYSTNIDSVLLRNLPSEKCRHYVLANLLFYIWVILVFEKCFKQT